MSTTMARRLFAAIGAAGVAEDQVCDALLQAVGVDPNEPDAWPMQDFTFDSTDESFEFKQVTVGWVPTEDQIAACLALGFKRCWICYTDGTERAYVRPSQ